MKSFSNKTYSSLSLFAYEVRGYLLREHPVAFHLNWVQAKTLCVALQ